MLFQQAALLIWQFGLIFVSLHTKLSYCAMMR